MSAPRDLGPDFRSWLDDVPPMPPELPQRTLDEIRHTRQRRRRPWSLPGPKLNAGADSERDDTSQRIVAIETSGGTTSTFSAAKLFGLAASVALLGAVALAVPFASRLDTQGPAAADSGPGHITMYTGSFWPFAKKTDGTIERYDWGLARLDEQWTSGLEMSDPRISGVQSCYSNVYETGLDGVGWLRTFRCRLFPDDVEATWEVTGRGYMDPGSTGIHYQSSFVGEGDYEGLFAIQRCDAPAYGAPFECVGSIFEGEFPPMPEAAPEERPDWAPPGRD